MNRLLLIGGGGHCRSVLDCIDRSLYEELAICDLESRIGQIVDGVPIIGCDRQIVELRAYGFTDAAITLGSIGKTTLRKSLYHQALAAGFRLPPVIAPSALVSTHAIVGSGTFVGKGAIINAGACIGCCCIINTGAIIEHDCRINNFVHLAPGTVLSGSVQIGANTHLGTNTTVLQNIQIGEDTLVGAGSVVVRNLPSGVRALGNPCRIRGETL